jgi:hypothetical protein
MRFSDPCLDMLAEQSTDDSASDNLHHRLVAQDRICARHASVMQSILRLIDAPNEDDEDIPPIWPKEWQHDFPCITQDFMDNHVLLLAKRFRYDYGTVRSEASIRLQVSVARRRKRCGGLSKGTWNQGCLVSELLLWLNWLLTVPSSSGMTATAIDMLYEPHLQQMFKVLEMSIGSMAQWYQQEWRQPFFHILRTANPKRSSILQALIPWWLGWQAMPKAS